MKYTTYPSAANSITEVLETVGIEFSTTYIPNSVPCQTKTEIEMRPKNELETLACIGAIK